MTLVFLWRMFQEISKVQLYDTESVPVLNIFYEGKKDNFMWKVCLFVHLSVTKGQQLNHFSGSYEI